MADEERPGKLKSFPSAAALRFVIYPSNSGSRMDYFEDSDIKAVWVYQFAKRTGSVAARLALVTLIGIIKERSGAADAVQTAAAA